MIEVIDKMVVDASVYASSYNCTIEKLEDGNNWVTIRLIDEDSNIVTQAIITYLQPFNDSHLVSVEQDDGTEIIGASGKSLFALLYA